MSNCWAGLQTGSLDWTGLITGLTFELNFPTSSLLDIELSHMFGFTLLCHLNVGFLECNICPCCFINLRISKVVRYMVQPHNASVKVASYLKVER